MTFKQKKSCAPCFLSRLQPNRIAQLRSPCSGLAFIFIYIFSHFYVFIVFLCFFSLQCICFLVIFNNDLFMLLYFFVLSLYNNCSLFLLYFLCFIHIFGAMATNGVSLNRAHVGNGFPTRLYRKGECIQ